ncbi:hypothetical protein V6615_13795 [Oscillospiraceae bacterium PP1C4]
MKKLLCCILCAAVFCTGCASRNTAPASSEPLPSESAVSDAPTEKPRNTQSSQAPSKSAEEFPAPELSEMERKLLDEDASLFMSYFDTVESAASSAELDKGLVLSYCLTKILQQKDLMGYIFETDEAGTTSYIPADLVTETAQRLFGLENFSFTEKKTYNKETQTYKASGHGYGTFENRRFSEIMGAPDGNIAYIATFSPTPDTEFKTPTQITKYTFKILRLNGMPYLQFVSAAPAA